MATKTKTSPQNPVAGQPGYQLESEDQDRMVHEVHSSEPERIMPKAPRKAPVLAVAAAKDATGMQLYEWLISTEGPDASGTNPDKLRDARAWLDTVPDATCEAFLHQLEDPVEGAMEIAQGTLRKAGKWVFGPTWEPESACLQAPTEEIARLRAQLVTAEEQAKLQTAAAVNLRAHITFLTQRNEQLAGQVDYLKSGKTQQELYMLGIQHELQPAGR